MTTHPAAHPSVDAAAPTFVYTAGDLSPGCAHQSSAFARHGVMTPLAAYLFLRSSGRGTTSSVCDVKLQIRRPFFEGPRRGENGLVAAVKRSTAYCSERPPLRGPLRPIPCIRIIQCRGGKGPLPPASYTYTRTYARTYIQYQTKP